MARHILLADDSTTIHRIVEDILAREGFQVTCVENGEEALRSILEDAPDLVLADLTMPRMGGFELCELLRREQEFRNIPVVFLVGPFDEYHESTAARVGGSGHISKPFDSYRLLSMVHRFLSNAPAEPPPSSRAEDTEEGELLDDQSVQGLPPVGYEPRHMDELADLPEPMALSGSDPADLPPLSGLDLAEGDRTIELDAAGLAMIATELEAEDAEGEPAGRASSPSVADATQWAASLSPEALERIARDVIREEVARILPGIVDAVVRERIQEIELELEARARVKQMGTP